MLQPCHSLVNRVATRLLAGCHIHIVKMAVTYLLQPAHSFNSRFLTPFPNHVTALLYIALYATDHMVRFIRPSSFIFACCK